MILDRAWQALVFPAWWAVSHLVPRERLVRICDGCGNPMDRLEPLSTLAPPGVTYWVCHTRRRTDTCWALSPYREPWRVTLDHLHVPRYPLRTLADSTTAHTFRTALAGIHAWVWPPYRLPSQQTKTASSVQCVASPRYVAENPSDQVATTSTGMGSWARVTWPRTAPPASSRSARPSTRPMIEARPDSVLLAAGAAGALTVASGVAVATSWWWARLTHTPSAHRPCEVDQ